MPLYQRKSIRLQGYDYRQSGAYFVTILTYKRMNTLGDVYREDVVLSELGKIVKQVWEQIPSHFVYVDLDFFVIMPNHFHGILIITDNPAGSDSSDSLNISVRAQHVAPLQAPLAHTSKPKGITPNNVASGSLGAIIRSFKGTVTRLTHQMGYELPIWHRNYYEHIIRDEKSLNSIREYILYNPAKWEIDSLYQK